MERSDFLRMNVKCIQTWAHGQTSYKFTRPSWAYEILPLDDEIRISNRDQWPIAHCSSQFDITEHEDRLSGVSMRPVIKPRPANVEIQPIELQIWDERPADPGPFEMLPISQDMILDPIQTFIPVPIMRIVCTYADQSSFSANPNSFIDYTPRPLPPSLQVFSAIRQRGTPQAPWSVLRPAFDNSCFASPQLQPLLEEIPDIIKPPKLPKK